MPDKADRRTVARTTAVLALTLLTIVALRGYLPGPGDPPPEDTRPAGTGSLVVVIALLTVSIVVIAIAVSLMLPHVVRWNAAIAGALYADLLDGPSATPDPSAGERLAGELEQVAAICGFPLSLEQAGVPDEALASLAEGAAAQWTGGFNPRPLTREAALDLYRTAWRR